MHDFSRSLFSPEELCFKVAQSWEDVVYFVYSGAYKVYFCNYHAKLIEFENKVMFNPLNNYMFKQSRMRPYIY